MPEPILTTIVAAVVAGAVTAAGSVASQAIADAYSGLKSMIIRKLDNRQSEVLGVEENPDDMEAQERLAKRLAEKGLHQDPELKAQAERVTIAVTEAQAAGIPGIANINVEDIHARLEARITDLIASGSITVRNITGRSVNVSGLRSGAGATQPSEGHLGQDNSGKS
jgi:hypothetical protein